MDVKIVGILNITPDSFSDGGLYLNENLAVAQFRALIEDGADIVDIGAVSTNYDSVIPSEAEERDRLNRILKVVSREYGAKISIDTFRPKIAQEAIELGVCMINDVTGGKNPEMMRLIAKNPHVKYVMMCSLCIPSNKKIRMQNKQEIYNHANKMMQNAISYGIQQNQIIIDPGIGFVSDAVLSIDIIKNISYFKSLNAALYIGHSRKSFMRELFNKREDNDIRDIQTIAASFYLSMQEIKYLRVHNVKWHKSALDLLNALL
ncbi:MAG: dihydropteroate synthase [Proteobacteria bacterium]|nr:dihydropteroate synthase [Pseudomonadota bacterium]